MLLFLTVQWVFGPLAAPLGSATHDVLLNIVEVAVDHITNLFGQQGFGPNGCPSLQASLKDSSGCHLTNGELNRIVRLPLPYNFTS